MSSLVVLILNICYYYSQSSIPDVNYTSLSMSVIITNMRMYVILVVLLLSPDISVV